MTRFPTVVSPVNDIQVYMIMHRWFKSSSLMKMLLPILMTWSFTSTNNVPQHAAADETRHRHYPTFNRWKIRVDRKIRVDW